MYRKKYFNTYGELVLADDSTMYGEKMSFHIMQIVRKVETTIVKIGVI